MTDPTRRRIVLAALSGALIACSTPSKQPEVPVKTYRVTGIVKRLYPEKHTALIQHENIEGWMDAMTMEFPVRDTAEFAKLAEDQKITATLHVQDLDYWLTGINAGGR